MKDCQSVGGFTPAFASSDLLYQFTRMSRLYGIATVPCSVFMASKVPGRKSLYSPELFHEAIKSSAGAMCPCLANWNAWVPPPLLTAGFVRDATEVENFATKLDHAIAWYLTVGSPCFGVYASVIFRSSELKLVPPHGMFQNWIGAVLERLLLPPPEEQAARPRPARVPPAAARNVLRETGVVGVGIVVPF